MPSDSSSADPTPSGSGAPPSSSPSLAPPTSVSSPPSPPPRSLSPPLLVRTTTSATDLSTTTTLYAHTPTAQSHLSSHSHPHHHSHHHSLHPNPRSTPPTGHQHCHPPTPPPIPVPDVVAFFDPAAAGGGGPLVRIATAHSQRELAREQSRGGGGVDSRARGVGAIGGFTPCNGNGESDTKPKAAPSAVAVDADEKLASKGDTDDDEERAEKCSVAQKDGSCCSADDETEHVYPDGGYGWVVVLCCTTLCAVTNGWGMAYGVFQEYYSKYTFPTAQTSVISLTGTTQGFFFCAMAFVSGRLGDRYGFKRVLIIAAFFCWLGLFAAAFSRALWSTILTQGCITGIGQGIAVPLFMSLPSQWFYKHRGLASGITMGGAGLGGGLNTIIIRRLLTQVGVSKTLLIMSFVNLFAMAVSIALIRVRPTSPEAGQPRGPIFNKEIMTRSDFWSVSMSLLIGVIGYPNPMMFLNQWVGQRFPEYSGMKLTAPLTILAFCVILGRALVGYVADKAGAMNTYILVLVLSGVVQLAVWLTAKSYVHICLFGALYGLIAPGYLGLLPQIVVTVFGPAALASNTGLLLLFNAPGNLVSGPLAGALFDITGRTSFKWSIVVMAALQILGGLIACWARFRASSKLFAKI